MVSGAGTLFRVADPDSTFHFKCVPYPEPDRASCLSDAILRPLVSPDLPGLHFEPPRLHYEPSRPSTAPF